MNQHVNRQFAPPARTRKVSSAKVEHRREEQRLDRKVGLKRPPKKTYYERQLEKFGFTS